MKKIYLPFVSCMLAAAIWSCNNSSTASAESDSSAHANTDSMNSANTNNNPVTPPVTTPLSKDDSAFVMKAATGGLAEVQMGTLAQQKGVSQRVKDFGAMMVRDHSKANDELSSLASSHGITVPSTLPAEMQKHMDAMNKLSGKAFDQHYVSMMVEDHQKDINEFKKASTMCNDNDLKTWAGKTLPTLQTHLDSIQAIKKMKM